MHIPTDRNKIASTIDIVKTNCLHETDCPTCHTLSSDHNAVITNIELTDFQFKSKPFISVLILNKTNFLISI